MSLPMFYAGVWGRTARGLEAVRGSLFRGDWKANGRPFVGIVGAGRQLKRHALISFLCDKCEYRRRKDDKSCGSGRARASTQ
jgi:hypothetical protein